MQRAVLPALLALLCAPLLAACDMGCSTENGPKIISPDSAKAAAIVTRDCGATDSVVSRIYVFPASDDVPDADNQPVVMVDKGSLSFRWMGPRQLEIDLKTSRVFVQQKSAGDVTVTYVGNPTYP